MNRERLTEILLDCLGDDGSDEGLPEGRVSDGSVRVDCHVGVVINKTIARSHRDEIVTILDDWPSELEHQSVKPLRSGPNYIHVGWVIGSQTLALMLFAVGKVLKFWDVWTPRTFGLEGEEAAEAAGLGAVMIGGYKPDGE